jgi:hypothetical protein
MQSRSRQNMISDTQPHPPTLEGLQRQLIELQIAAIHERLDDHEKRMRLLETTATKFDFILYLTMGGGLVGLMNLLGVVYVVIDKTK